MSVCVKENQGKSGIEKKECMKREQINDYKQKRKLEIEKKMQSLKRLL